MKKAIFAAAAILIVALLLMNRSGVSTQQEQVGVLLPLSSDFAWWGETIQNSITIAQSHGYMKDAEFIYSDTKCNSKDAVSGIQYLKNLYPRMNLFIVGCDNDLKVMKPYLGKKDLAFVVGLSETSLYEMGIPTINLAYRLESEGTAAGEFIRNRLVSKTLGIIVSNTDFGIILGKNAENAATKSGGSAVTETIKYNEKNPESSILKILAAKPDTIYIHNDIPAMVAILKRLDQLGYKGNRFVYYGGRDQSIIDSAGAAAEGVYTLGVISEKANEKRLKFEQDYKSTFGKQPFVTGYFIYDGLNFLNDASKSCARDAKCIENYFYSTKDFEGTLGTVRYHPNGEVDRKFNFEQIRQGKFVGV